jgi:hypothetical protein
MTTLKRLALCAVLGAATGAAHASCGATYCTLLNDRFALGTWDHLGWSADFRLESVAQNRLRSGTRTLSAAEVSGEEAIERRTRNLNLVSTVERSFDRQWSVALRLPLVRRDHLHDLVDDITGAIGPAERWTFTKVGDAQVLGRWQNVADAPDFSWALTGGLQLPTGGRQVVNADGTRAERSLQPGSGTTDLVLGVSARMAFGGADALSLQATLAQALAAREDYKPGRRLDVSAGWSHAISTQWSAALQINLSNRARDSGSQSEPDNSGSTTLSLSPGATVSVAAQSIVYAYLQVPVYQKTNGIQLVPRSSLAVGYTQSF